MAQVDSEPRPPKGIDPSKLSDTLSQAFGPAGLSLYEWFSVQEPVWGRTLASRLVKVQGECKTMESQQ